MYLQKNILVCLTAVLLGSALAGCQSPKSVMAVGGGYEEVSHRKHSLIAGDDPVPPRIAFQYRSAGGTVTPIWPSLYGVGEVVNGKVAVFVGDKAYVDPDKGTRPRLFAVESPDMPLDITDEVLREWATATHRDFTLAQDRLNIITPEVKNGDLALRMDFSSSEDTSRGVNWPAQSILRLTWNQVDYVMQSVKARGIQKKDLYWKTPYIGEKGKS